MRRLEPYLREITPTLTLAVPIIMSQVSQMLIGVTDSVMIGHAGTVPLAASSFGGNIFMVFYVLGIGMMVPISIFVARARGAARIDEASEYLRHGVAIAGVVGLVECLALLILSSQLHRFDQPPEVLAIVRPFFLLVGASILPVLLYQSVRQFAEALGRAWVPTAIMLGAVLVNVLLNWVFIYGNLGAPALGLTGAGVATLVARTLEALVIVAWVRLDPVTRRAWPATWLAPLSWTRLREMLHVGLPASGMLFFECSAFAFSAVMMGWLGAVPLAAHQITLSCASMSFMFPLGLSMATGMRVSQAVGAREPERLRPITFSAMAVAVAMMGGFGLAFGFGGPVIAAWFVEDTLVIALAAQLLVVAALFQLFDGLQVTGSAALRAITDVRIPALMTFVAYWVISLPLGYLLGIRGPLGAVGLWIGVASGLAVASVFFILRFAALTRRRT